jgi:hypothetical protein
VFGEQEWAGQHQREESVPPILGELRDRRHVLEPGVRDDHVEAAELVEGRLYCGLVPLAGGQVCSEGGAGPTVRGSCRFKIHGENVYAVLVEPVGDR